MDALATLQRLGQGTLIDQVHRALTEVADEVVLTGKKGTVTVTLTIQPAQPDGDPCLLAISEDVKKGPPKKASRGAFLYSVDGEFHRNDPRQTTFEFRSVDNGAGELRQPEHAEPVVRSAAD